MKRFTALTKAQPRRIGVACAAILLGATVVPLAHGQTNDAAPSAIQTPPDAAISEIGAALEQLETFAAPPAENAPVQGAPDIIATPQQPAPTPLAPKPVAAPKTQETVTAAQRAHAAALRTRLDNLRSGGEASLPDPAALQAVEALAARVAMLEKEAGAAAWRAQEYTRYRDAIRDGVLTLPPALALEDRPERGETRPSLEIAPEIVQVQTTEPKAAYASASLTDAAAPLPNGTRILRLGLYRAPGVRLVVGWALGRGQMFTGEQDLVPFAGE